MITKLSRLFMNLRVLALALASFVGVLSPLQVTNAAPDQGPGGPILVITNGTTNFGKFYAEILRTEGFNSFAVEDIATVTSTTLNNYDVVILAKTTVSSGQATMLTNWVNAGGNLIAMDPAAQLASLLGITQTASTLANAYLRVDTTTKVGAGIVGETIQFHGTAQRNTLNGAVSLATLYSSAATATVNPAITLRSVGASGGQAAAFAYDLATSIVYTRQGNPAWATQERDGFAPRRSSDMFYGAAASDPQPDWIDLSKVAIPQADEQQRLLANLIVEMNADRKPLPRFWYFPNGHKAAVIMTGDDHGYLYTNGGATAARFNQFISASPAGCSVQNWECVRGTSYVFTDGALTNAQAAAFQSQGFEIGLHINTLVGGQCTDYTQSSLTTLYSQQLAPFTVKFPGVAAPATQRHHCVVWSDWASGAKVQLANGMRLDTTYYYWPPGWVNNVPGHFSGSAMPMRFADLDGTLIDVYQAVSQMTDESGQEYPYTVDTLLDRAVGTEENYGAYTVNAHTDIAGSVEADTSVASAQERGLPVVSARQMLTWLDGRNGSSFGSLAWSNNTLTFTVVQAAGANGLQALLPRRANNRVLSTVVRNGGDVPFEVKTIKGLEYAAFPAAAGNYTATYLADASAPTVAARFPASGASGVQVSAKVSATFSEAIDPATINSNTVELRNPSNALVAGTLSYDPGTFTATLTPSAPLAPLTTYTVTLRGGTTDPRIKDLSGNALAANVTWSFTTAGAPTCPCTIWDASATPAVASDSDTNSVELGVKFRSDISGFITGIRFYKGPNNGGTHVATLWSSSGDVLATAPFSNETATGWQQVTFASPVAITANVTYVASYHAPNGGYAANANYFTTNGVDNAMLHALSSPAAGGNGIYAYGGGSVFPTSTFQGANYWVDVVFNTTGGSGDAVPPTVTITSPTNGTTFATNANAVGLAGSATDNVAVTQVTWSNDRGGNGTASGTGAWSIPSVTLQTGTNVITVTARDAANNTSTDTLSVTYTPPTSDTTPPTISTRVPASGATGVAPTSAVTVTFNEALDPATVSSTTFELRNASNALVASTVSYAAASFTATITPSAALAASSSYTVTVRGGTTDPRVKDVAGNALAANSSWSFTTGTGTSSIWSASQTPPAGSTDVDPTSVELGTRFRANVDGQITAIRFYKHAQNTGTHIGNLWTASGSLLSAATFSGETASGWQQVQLPAPISITANSWYVVSYHTNAGTYTGQDGMFASSGITNGPLYAARDGEAGPNGVYKYGASSTFPDETYGSEGYWVDVVFVAGSSGPDTTAPTVAARTPTAGATGVSVSTSVTATFSEALNASTVSTSTFELRNASNVLVPAAVSYNAATLTATLTPNSALALNSTYNVTLRGGATDPRVKDVAGNALAANVTWSFTTVATNPCAANAITAENCLTGSPASEWDVSGAGDPSIQGYATQISVNRGSTVSFKVKTTATNYRFDIYRMGYYGGLGARKVITVNPTASLPQNQPNCLTQAATGLIDCGNWAVSGSWTVPANATSGIYFAKLVRTDNGGASHIVFIVRDDSSTSDLVLQTSDTTWQAYNNYGGNSLYMGSPGTNPGRAYKVSYNRPFNTRAVDGGQDWVFNSEYPMVRWLEANGYNVSYISGIDTDRAGTLLNNHRTYVSIGHDEYWSAAQRANVEAARNAGVNLAFFSGNEMFWKVRWENSIDGSGTSYRTLVSYKETHAGAKIDPSAEWTGTWRDPRFSPPADGGRPENAVTGTLFTVNTGTSAIVVPSAEGKMRFWRNTSIATLGAGQSATLPNGTLGYEWDSDIDNGSRPAGLIRLSDATVSGVDMLQDYGSTYATGTANHALTFYRHSSGARVFGAGTIQWSWGLDANHDRAGTPSDVRMQQATVNLFADMGVQPVTLQSGLVAATASSDATAPTTAISAPTSGATLQPGAAFTITGTASDSGGVVAAVEVSVDGGASWHPATGRGSWTYVWTPSGSGAATVRARAVDDSGNIQGSPTTVNVTIGGSSGACPCSLWSSQVPSVSPDVDPGAVVLGTRFRTSINGKITAIRFYKNAGNTGTHVGRLWTATGTLLGTVTFSGETASGWQQAPLPAAVNVTANTWYVVSYSTSAGSYIGQDGMFAAAGVSSGPLYAARDGEGGANGLYAYGGSTTFPNQTYASEGYWVDVVFTQ